MTSDNMTSDTAEGGDGAFAEHTALVELFGNHPKVKILVSLLSKGHDINVSQIAVLAGTSRSTVYNHLDDLIELNVVEHTRNVGGSPMYQINRDSQVAKKIAQLEWELID